MIPKLHYISQGKTKEEHLGNIQKACTSGAELVRLNCTEISEKKLLKLASEAREVTSHFQTRLLITGNYKVAKEVKADGVHLEITDSCPTIVRKYLYNWQIIGGTAHTFQDCETLLDKRVNYIGLGPFRAAANRDKVIQALGLAGYIAITDVLKTGTPIIGFGDITTNDVTAILKTGISGIAVSEAIARDFNSIKKFHELLSASSTAEKRHTF